MHEWGKMINDAKVTTSLPRNRHTTVDALRVGLRSTSDNEHANSIRQRTRDVPNQSLSVKDGLTLCQ